MVFWTQLCSHRAEEPRRGKRFLSNGAHRCMYRRKEPRAHALPFRCELQFTAWHLCRFFCEFPRVIIHCASPKCRRSVMMTRGNTFGDALGARFLEGCRCCQAIFSSRCSEKIGGQVPEPGVPSFQSSPTKLNLRYTVHFPFSHITSAMLGTAEPTMLLAPVQGPSEQSLEARTLPVCA